MATHNYRATVAYDGTDYSGFQIQAQQRATIQGELEQALQRLTQESVRVTGAGRTDAGVHAYGQVISFQTAWSHGCEALERALNAVLPRAIAVRGVAEVEERFHARFSASSRSYVYNVYNAPVRAPLLERFARHVSGALDLRVMSTATASLLGERDFAAFGQPPIGTNTVRCVRRAAWRAGEAVFGLQADPGLGALLQFEIEANAFLRGMVRRVVAGLLAVGLGLLTERDFAEVLASRDISRAEAPAPACGLCLWQVYYNLPPEANSQENKR